MHVNKDSRVICEEGVVHIAPWEVAYADMETLCGFQAPADTKRTKKAVTCQACMRIAEGVLRSCKLEKK